MAKKHQTIHIILKSDGICITKKKTEWKEKPKTQRKLLEAGVLGEQGPGQHEKGCEIVLLEIFNIICKKKGSLEENFSVKNIWHYIFLIVSWHNYIVKVNIYGAYIFTFIYLSSI